MADEPSRGPEVPPHEDLLRCIFRPEFWDPDGDYVSPAIFGFDKFSAFIASLTSELGVLQRFPEGCGMLKFNSGVARQLGFDARHEPENSVDAHANVYRTRRKGQARRLMEAETTAVTVKPDIDRLRASSGD